MRQRHRRGSLAPMNPTAPPLKFAEPPSRPFRGDHGGSSLRALNPRLRPRHGGEATAGRAAQSDTRSHSCLPALRPWQGGAGVGVGVDDQLPDRSSSVVGKSLPLPHRCWSPTGLRECLHMQGSKGRDDTKKANGDTVVPDEERLKHSEEPKTSEGSAEKLRQRRQQMAVQAIPHESNGEAQQQPMKLQATAPPTLPPLPSCEVRGQTRRTPMIVRDKLREVSELIAVADQALALPASLPSLSSSSHPSRPCLGHFAAASVSPVPRHRKGLDSAYPRHPS